MTDPLSQNRYSYVHNNPVNYTDPSGHFWKSIKKAASKAWNGAKKAASNAWNTVKRVATNTWNTVKSAVSHAVNWVSNKVSQAVNWVGTQVNHVKNWAVQQWNNYQSRTSYHASPLGGYGGGYYYPTTSHAYVQQQQAQARAQAEKRRQQKISDEYRQATGLKSTPKTREGKNLFRNWGKALAETLKHVCNPKTAEAKDKATTKPTVSESFKKEVNKLDYEELTKKYKGLISAQHSYQGTGYGYIVRSPKQLLEDQFVMKRYRELKAKEDAKQAAHIAELNKYHYLNIYDSIRKTGRRSDGTPATDLEKKIAPFVPLIPIVQNGASIYAGVQVAKYNSSVPKENGMKLKSGNSTSSSPKPKTDYSQNRKYWKNEVEFNGNKVYQRDDLIDPNVVSSWKENGVTVTGTNVERMASGRSPIGPDGKSIELHHTTQRQTSSIAETTYTFHKQNSKTIHINPNTISLGINRNEFGKWRGSYWENRAKDFID
ncbi:HNH/ENDO VII family nuclease [Streptococcus pluranimalium]|uniref:HNH/ENDO VII family nuclease n=1 Tax=Streptococcus pluranimalium TaxID=82348 RepID=UPI003BF7EF5D